MKNSSLLQNMHGFFPDIKRVILYVFSILLTSLFLAFSAANAQAPHISYASPQLYNANVAINALSPTNTGGAVPVPTTTTIGNYGQEVCVAVDASHNIYTVGGPSSNIIEIPAAGGSNITLATKVTANGLTVDKTGNVYFCHGSFVYKIPAGTKTVITVVSNLIHTGGIAVDDAGNLYVSEYTIGDIKKIAAGSTTPVTVATGLGVPTGIALDAAGNIYAADEGNGEHAVKKILAGTGTVVTLPAGSSNDVEDVAVDVYGNVYFVCLDNTTVTEIPVGGGSNIVIASGFYYTQCIALDDKGDIFVGNAGFGGSGPNGGLLQKIPAGGYSISPLPPAGLSLNTRTGVISGTPTVASPATNYTVTATNSSGSGTATVNIKVISGSNKSLSHLTLSKGVLSPAYNPATTSYSVSVAGTVTSVSLTPTLTGTATATINGTAVASGSASPAIPLTVGANAIHIEVDSATTETDYTVTITRPSSANASLSLFKISRGTLTPTFTSGTTSYTASVANGVTSMTVTPTAADPSSTITVNGTAVASGSPSGAIALSVGTNTINTVVTASDGTTTKTYTLVVTEPGSTNANLSLLKISKGTLSPAFNINTTSYTTSEANTVNSITVTPTAVVNGSTIKVNGTTVASGTASGPIELVPGTNTITTVVTATDGSTTKTYTIVVSEAASNNANLSSFKASRGTYTPVFSPTTTSYTASVGNGATSTIITPTAAANGATIKVNGTTVASGSPSGAIALSVGANVITTVVTASDGTTTKTYTLTITRAGSPGSNITDEALSINQAPVTPPIDNDGIMVHQGISPNGDGINDFLTIENIAQYPDNKLSIMNRNGALIYEAKGYDNSTKVFDGHSNKTGQMQLPGTYFYELEYTVKGIVKHRTGYLVLKY